MLGKHAVGKGLLKFAPLTALVLSAVYTVFVRAAGPDANDGWFVLTFNEGMWRRGISRVVEKSRPVSSETFSSKVNCFNSTRE